MFWTAYGLFRKSKHVLLVKNTCRVRLLHLLISCMSIAEMNIPVFILKICILSPHRLRRPGRPGHSLSSCYVTARKSTKCVEQSNWWSELMWSRIARPTGVFIRSIWHRCVSNLSLIKRIIPTTICDDANSEAAMTLFQDEKRAKSMEITAIGIT